MTTSSSPIRNQHAKWKSYHNKMKAPRPFQARCFYDLHRYNYFKARIWDDTWYVNGMDAAVIYDDAEEHFKRCLFQRQARIISKLMDVKEKLSLLPLFLIISGKSWILQFSRCFFWCGPDIHMDVYHIQYFGAEYNLLWLYDSSVVVSPKIL